jgi:hypothetical protein
MRFLGIIFSAILVALFLFAVALMTTKPDTGAHIEKVQEVTAVILGTDAKGVVFKAATRVMLEDGLDFHVEKGILVDIGYIGDVPVTYSWFANVKFVI